MTAFTTHLSDDAAGMLDEMRSLYGVKPEDVIRVIVEGSLADALLDSSLFRGLAEQAECADENAREHWTSALEVIIVSGQQK